MNGGKHRDAIRTRFSVSTAPVCLSKMENRKLNEKELEQIIGGAHNTIYIHGLETIAPYAAAHKDMPVSPSGSYSEAERQLIPENTEAVLKSASEMLKKE